MTPRDPAAPMSDQPVEAMSGEELWALIERDIACRNWGCDHRPSKAALATLRERLAATERERDEERERFHRHVETMIEPALRERLSAAERALRYEIRHRFEEHDGWPGDLDEAVEAEFRAALTAHAAAEAARRAEGAE